MAVRKPDPDFGSLKIERGVRFGEGGTKWAKLASNMQPGDSVLVPETHHAERLKQAITRAHGAKAGAIRKEGEGYRVWRVERNDEGGGE